MYWSHRRVNPFLINQQEKNGGTRNRTTEQQDAAKTNPFQSKENKRRSMSNWNKSHRNKERSLPKKKKKVWNWTEKEVEGGRRGEEEIAPETRQWSQTRPGLLPCPKDQPNRSNESWSREGENQPGRSRSPRRCKAGRCGFAAKIAGEWEGGDGVRGRRRRRARRADAQDV